MNKKLTCRQDPSAKINTIRSNACKTLDTSIVKCPTCCRDADMPFRRHDKCGHIVAGCVDAFHTDYMVSGIAHHAWHWRPEAIAVRIAEFRVLESL